MKSAPRSETWHVHPLQDDRSSSKARKSGSPLQCQDSKIIHGPPKSLCLPRICELESTSPVLLVRQESPWDTYRRALTCDIAGQVFIAARRSRPSRVVAIRQYPRGDAVRLIHVFGQLAHANVLSVRECYIYQDSIYALVDDYPLTIAHLVSCEGLYPTEVELSSIMFQVWKTAVSVTVS